MNTKHNIVKHILGLFVALSILLPSSLSLAHTFENHEHYTQCDNALDVHVHEKKQECKFHLINYNKDGVFALTKTPSFVPATTKSSADSSCCSGVGFKMYSPSI